MSDFKVKDTSLADFGRKEISLAETEMPGLMALRKEYKNKFPLKDAKILGCFTHHQYSSSVSPFQANTGITALESPQQHGLGLKIYYKKTILLRHLIRPRFQSKLLFG